MTILGFTGTRHAITPFQRLWLHTQFGRGDVIKLHHGACVGADATAHRVALQHEIQVVAHPPTDKKLAMKMSELLSPRGGVVILADKPYHARNRDIVDSCDRLIALPDGPERAHSGTWYTVGYATGQDQVHTANRRVVPVTICYPDGTTEIR
jgi:hypothetical protein